eukprot:2634725-Pleurochrysis_carterae.AAC.1
MQSDSNPMRDRKAAMPSARAMEESTLERVCRREAWRLCGIPAGGLSRRRFRRGGCRAPWEVGFAEVDLGGGHDAAFR